MNFPQLPREPIRPERSKPEAEKELWHPTWKCFCCQDTGKVQLHLIRLVIPDYDHHQDKSVVCQNPQCQAGEMIRGNPNYDQRFTASICAKLDKFSREDWRLTQARKFVNIKALSEKIAMPGSCTRTENDNREVLLRKREIEAITHEQWMAMRSKYLGGESD